MRSRKRNRPIVHSASRAILRRYLAAGYAMLIAYASLSPFSGWQEQGLDFASVLASPLGQTYSWFDALSNLLAYFPLGLLLGLALRTRFNVFSSVLIATLAGLLLSASMEYLQMYLPRRISSNMDLLANGVGTLAGATLAASIAPLAWFGWVTQWRTQLFRYGHDADFGLALIFLWMFGQSNPSLPMLGNVFITEVAQQPFAPLPPQPFDWLESLGVAFNLSMLGGLLLSLLRARRHAVVGLIILLCSVGLTKFVVAALLLKSWALLLWLNGEAMLGIFTGLLLLAAASRLPRRRLLGAVAAVTVTYLILTNAVLDHVSPSAAMPLFQWRYGHLLNYNGLSDTITLIFPILLLLYLWHSGKRDSQPV